jgi:hypothetical protein
MCLAGDPARQLIGRKEAHMSGVTDTRPEMSE